MITNKTFYCIFLKIYLLILNPLNNLNFLLYYDSVKIELLILIINIIVLINTKFADIKKYYKWLNEVLDDLMKIIILCFIIIIIY